MSSFFWFVYTLIVCLALALVSNVALRTWLAARWATLRERLVELWERLPMMLTAGLIVALMTACSSSPVVRAVAVADSAAVVTQSAEPLLKRFCVDVIAGLPEVEYRARREVCDPAIATYEGLRTAHIALRAALLAYDAAKKDGGVDIVKLVVLEAEVRDAVIRLSAVILELARKEAHSTVDGDS